MTSPGHRTRGRSTAAGYGPLVGAAVAALVALAAWALAAAPASSPDDNFHLPSIWCAHGVGSERCESVPGSPGSRSVPAQASISITCYVFDATKSAHCQDPLMADHSARTVVEFGNWKHAYPPVYYWLAGWLVTGNVVTSVLLVRAFTGLVVVGLLAVLVALVPRRLRPVAVVPFLVCAVPLGMSLFSSTNPSAWGITGPAVVWVALHSAYATTGRRQVALSALAVLAAIIGAGARADACLFTVMAVVLALVLDVDLVRSRWVPSVAALVSVVVSGVLFLGAGQAGALSAGLAAQQVIGPASTMSPLELAVANLGQLPSLFTGIFGTTPIGWLDTPLPAAVSGLGLVVVIAVLALTWRRTTRRHAVALALSALALFVYPLYVLGKSHLGVGQGVQPRYLLPMAVIFVGLVLLTGGARLTRRQARLVAAGVAVANAVALHVQIRRYVTGLDVSGWNLDAGREWWWDIPVGPMAVWVVGTIAFGVVAVLVMELCTAETAAEPAANLER